MRSAQRTPCSRAQQARPGARLPAAAASRVRRTRKPARVLAVDAAFPEDFEAVARQRLEAQRTAAEKLCIGAQSPRPPRCAA